MYRRCVGVLYQCCVVYVRDLSILDSVLENTEGRLCSSGYLDPFVFLPQSTESHGKVANRTISFINLGTDQPAETQLHADNIFGFS